MLPPMVPKTQVLSQAVLHNGNCKRIQWTVTFMLAVCDSAGEVLVAVTVML